MYCKVLFSFLQYFNVDQDHLAGFGFGSHSEPVAKSNSRMQISASSLELKLEIITNNALLGQRE